MQRVIRGAPQLAGVWRMSCVEWDGQKVRSKRTTSESNPLAGTMLDTTST